MAIRRGGNRVIVDVVMLFGDFHIKTVDNDILREDGFLRQSNHPTGAVELTGTSPRNSAQETKP